MNRLATMFLLATATTACVASNDDLNLDGLPAYDADTGGGKGDDPNCTDASYREFIQGYLRGEVAVDVNPCAWGNDASYRIWAYAAGQQLTPMLTAYSAAQAARSERTASRGDVVAAGTLDASTRAQLDKLALVRPAHAGKVGVGAWREYLYAPSFAAATHGVGVVLGVSVDDIDQLNYEITPFEDAWLGFVEANQPEATEGAAWAIWWETVSSVFGLAWTPGGEQETALVARLAATHPAGAFDIDASYFQSEIVAPMVATATTSAARWSDKIALRPSGGGSAAYTAWAQNFATAYGYQSSSSTADQLAVLQLVIDTKPCASGADVDMLSAHLATRLATAGNAPDGTPLAEVVIPTACPGQ